MQYEVTIWFQPDGDGRDSYIVTVEAESWNEAIARASKLDVLGYSTEGFPIDRDGKPLAWEHPLCPGWYVDAWNGIYDSREFALSESRDWVADEAERRLTYGQPPTHDEDEVCSDCGKPVASGTLSRNSLCPECVEKWVAR